jgi:hypothetical protein
MRQAAMSRSFLWTGAAAEYEELYKSLIKPPSMLRTVSSATRARPRARPSDEALPAAA